MKINCKSGFLLALALSICTQTSHASNGMFLIGYGAKLRGMGGVGLALHEDSIITAVNPAGTSFVDNRVDAGLLLFNPKRLAACCLSPDGQVSEKGWFLLPNVGFAYEINDKYSFGLGMVGYAGGRTYYKPNIFDAAPDAPAAGVNLEIGMMSPTISYKIKENQAIGVSLLIAGARFEALGLGPFKQFSKHRDFVSDNGHDWSFGAGLRIGWQGHFDEDKWSFAAVYQTETYMSKFDDYKGLFADEGSFNLPPMASLGLAYRPLPPLTIAFDWSRTFYEDIPAIANPALPIVAGDPTSPRALGAPTGPGFEWVDQDVFKLGVQYDLSEAWTVRGGINYGEHPIKNNGVGGNFEFNVLAPAVTEWHLTGGGTYAFAKHHEISFAIMHAFNNSDTQFVPPTADLPFNDQFITLEMEQWAWDIGYGYKF